MLLNHRTIKLGRLFMVAWLAFYLYPIAIVLSGAFSTRDKALALALLLGSAIVWIWFWTRVLAGPDQRFRGLAFLFGALLVGAFTLMTPPRYGTLFVYVVLIAGAAFPWRIAVPFIVIASVGGGVLDLIRDTTPLQATGDVLNDAIVGLAAVAGHQLIDANKQLSLAREQIARLAVGEERLRFARDLHDLLGHSLSVIALKSELAGRLIRKSPELAGNEVQDIEQVAREALREVRDAVTGYRQPTLSAELAGAREALTAAGVECRIDQEQHALPPAIEAALAWAVREGATNVMRHSKAHRCTIRISSRDGQVTLEVVDDGRGGTPIMGSGLLGLEERASQRGGRMTAAALPHEGFRLQVTLPLGERQLVDPVTA